MSKKREAESKPAAGIDHLAKALKDASDYDALGVQPRFPVYMRIPLERILEPELPARASMGSAEMEELAASLRDVGQIEPITLERRGEMFEIVTGHRRFLAARMLFWAEINALVYDEGQVDSLAFMLHENTVRESLNPAEEALFMAQAREKWALDEAGLVAKFKRSPDYIASRFALLRGDPEVFAAVQRADIKLGVAHQLNRITDEGMRRYYLDAARRADPPARVVAQWVSEWLAQERGRQLVVSAGGGGEGVTVNPNSPPGVGTPSDGAGSNPTDSAPAPFFGCQLCGGDRDPFNLVEIRLHRWEWEQILKSVERAARGA